MYSKKFKLLSDNQLLCIRGGESIWGTPLKTGITKKPPPTKPPDREEDIGGGMDL